MPETEIGFHSWPHLFFVFDFVFLLELELKLLEEFSRNYEESIFIL